MAVRKIAQRAWSGSVRLARPHPGLANGSGERCSRRTRRILRCIG